VCDVRCHACLCCCCITAEDVLVANVLCRVPYDFARCWKPFGRALFSRRVDVGEYMVERGLARYVPILHASVMIKHQSYRINHLTIGPRCVVQFSVCAVAYTSVRFVARVSRSVALCSTIADTNNAYLVCYMCRPTREPVDLITMQAKVDGTIGWPVLPDITIQVHTH
jgi:hypothetical protein